MNFIDLFAGAGGLSEGFTRAGFKPIVHVEMDEAACFTLKTRAAYHYFKDIDKNIYKDYLKGKIKREDLYKDLPDEILNSIINLSIGPEYNERIHRRIQQQLQNQAVDLIIGGPPCQAYSLVGRARSQNGMKGDPRNFLYVQYAQYLEKYKPKLFVFENVIGLKSANKGGYLKNMEALFLKKGYKMHLFTVEADNFGVLQKRKRIVIIGWKDDFIPNLPDLEAIRTRSPYKVKNIFNDLPKLQAGEGRDKSQLYRTKSNIYLDNYNIRNSLKILTQHVARPHTIQDKKIYKIVVDTWNQKGERLNYNDLDTSLKTHSNRHSFVDRFKIVADNLNYSQTIVAHICKDGHYYIHPDIEQNRSISVREAARLQSFPDDYYFEGVKEAKNRTAAFKQIGNAVPPLMSYEIARELLRSL
ncbi:DNA cytosine methyltransferase [Limnovirga soli]|uniref:Cytosine-specific methyltransferase n=1 Tax=Limnovirga soli TaxID=2656915 RepID=A0A8J8JVE5_9BACT|nr:DNA (cytosine-5-)-methyltransferase [Limnovirga soli]NNV57305.1 DNA (cytosine-5-)-methyltransferase [Limnovirga soli]